MTDSPVWDPDQYHRFGDLRLRPALELLQRVRSAQPQLVHDIGTGGGEIARLMKQRWPTAHVIGSDTSAEMLEKAAATPSDVEWRHMDIAQWEPDPEHDVIYSNAVLHWLPDHAELFPRLVGGLAPGGELAVQMPMSWFQPSHEAIRESLSALQTAEADALARHMATPNVSQPANYWEVLSGHVTELDVWETTYHQVLEGDDPVFEWISGSILRPVIAGLPEEQLAAFSVDCRRRLRAAYPPMADGRTIFPFRRLFIVAQR